MAGVQRARGTAGEAGKKTSPDNGGPGLNDKDLRLCSVSKGKD